MTKKLTELSAALLFLVGLQAAAALVLRFVPFGFDKPSSWGLDFNHAVVVIGVYLFSLLGGLMLAIWKRQWAALAIQLVVMLFLAWPIFFSAPAAPVRPAAESAQ